MPMVKCAEVRVFRPSVRFRYGLIPPYVGELRRWFEFAREHAAVTDIIFISDLRIDAVIGIYEWERRVKQTLSIDLELACDCAKAAASDSVEDTVNYKQVSKRLQEFVGDSEFRLVETLAERIAALILDEFSVRALKLRVNKIGALRGAAGVGVIIERGETG